MGRNTFVDPIRDNLVIAIDPAPFNREHSSASGDTGSKSILHENSAKEEAPGWAMGTDVQWRSERSSMEADIRVRFPDRDQSIARLSRQGSV
jgi:hypothetical protein